MWGVKPQPYVHICTQINERRAGARPCRHAAIPQAVTIIRKNMHHSEGGARRIPYVGAGQWSLLRYHSTGGFLAVLGMTVWCFGGFLAALGMTGIYDPIQTKSRIGQPMRDNFIFSSCPCCLYSCPCPRFSSRKPHFSGRVSWNNGREACRGGRGSACRSR